jgi:F-type H+-transporting ATPase subunit alpha
MKKVAGRLRLELSQYRELEAFAQFGSELDPDTQATLARGERLVATLNQKERSPLPVEEQVVQIYSATNGYLDRISVEKVPEFLDGLVQRLRAEKADLLEEIAGGDWSDETQDGVKAAVGEYADDFGYDLDEEGHPMDAGESDRIADREGRGAGAGGDGADADEDAGEDATREQAREEETAPA